MGPGYEARAVPTTSGLGQQWVGPGYEARAVPTTSGLGQQWVGPGYEARAVPTTSGLGQQWYEQMYRVPLLFNLGEDPWLDQSSSTEKNSVSVKVCK